MRKAVLTSLLLILTVGTSGFLAHEGRLALFLTTESGSGAELNLDARQVIVEFTKVEIFDAEDRLYRILFEGSLTYDLLALGGRQALLALADELEEGDYTRVRFTLSKSPSRVINSTGRSFPLRIEDSVAETFFLSPDHRQECHARGRVRSRSRKRP